MKTFDSEPTLAVRDLGMQVDSDAAALINRTLRLAGVHDRAVTRETLHDSPATDPNVNDADLVARRSP